MKLEKKLGKNRKDKRLLKHVKKMVGETFNEQFGSMVFKVLIVFLYDYR